MKHQSSFLSKQFRKIMVAGVLTNAIMCMEEVLDLLLAGIFLGETAVKTINVLEPVILMSTFIFLFMGIGVPILYGERMGKFDKVGADRIFSTGLMGSCILAVITVVLEFSCLNLYLDLYSLEEAVSVLVRQYAQWAIVSIAIGGPEYFLYAMVLIDGDNKAATISGIGIAAVRLIMACVLVPYMGISGLPIANIIANVAAVGMLLPHFFKKNNSLHFVMSFDLKSIPCVAKYAIVDASVYAFSSIFTLFLNKFSENRFGAAGLIIASTICFTRELFPSLDGIGLGMEPFINVYRGQKSNDGIRKVTQMGLCWSVILGIILNIIMFLAAPLIVKYMGITDPEIIRTATAGVRIMSFGSVFNGVVYCITSHYVYIERIAMGVMGSGLNNCLVMILSVFVFAELFGIRGAFIGMAVTPVFSAVIMSVYIIIKYGRKMYPYMLGRQEGIDDDKLFEYELNESGVAALKERVEDYLKEWNYSKKTIYGILLRIEETALYVRDRNLEMYSEITYKSLKIQETESSTGKMPQMDETENSTGKMPQMDVTENSTGKMPQMDETENMKTIRGECNLILGNNINVIMCDDGQITDISLKDGEVHSLRDYVLQRVINTGNGRFKVLVTTGNNRYMFEVPGEKC